METFKQDNARREESFSEYNVTRGAWGRNKYDKNHGRRKDLVTSLVLSNKLADRFNKKNLIKLYLTKGSWKRFCDELDLNWTRVRRHRYADVEVIYDPTNGMDMDPVSEPVLELTGYEWG